ncbi:MAG: TGS domain-containing protein, partial [Nocardioidaceae bacterium]
MSELNVAVVRPDQRVERTVTTGTKAWELFADEPEVVAARVDGELVDLARELSTGDVVEGVTID